MKLSPAQQHVVDLLREGWELHSHGGLISLDELHVERVHKGTFWNLAERGIIGRKDDSWDAAFILREEKLK